MFITTPQNNIIALDAKTGTQLWRYVRKYPDGLVQLHPTNRGVALYGDYVYMATTDCALVALNASTGKEAWSVPLDDYKTGCYSTLAPLAVRGKIIAGYSGGELGVRGSVNAFDALTGKRIWKTYTVPAPNEPGGGTRKGETYKRGGGSTWITGVYDPASNTTYWGTGNPGPWVADDRPGDNLYTDSTLALDADTGTIKSSRSTRCSTTSASTGSPTPPHRRRASTGRTPAPDLEASPEAGSNCQWRRRSFRTRYSARRRPGRKHYGRTCFIGMNSTKAAISPRSSSQSSSPRSCERPSGHGELSNLAVVRTPSWCSAEYELKRRTGSNS
jgi:hypothetical protein